LSGIQVQLLNANGTVPLSFRHSTTTGSTGSFQFSGLPWGSYLLRCEHPGMHSVTVPVTLSAQNPSHQSTTFSAGTTGFMVTSSVRNLLGGPRSTLKPNPVRAGQSLHWLIEEEEGISDRGVENPAVSWEITDLQGKIHGQGSAVEAHETPNGSGLGGTLSLDGIAPGMYLLRVHRPSGSPLQGRFLVLP
ncbi:MAG: SdrD B-like domain, partial [Bacteroidota bacterium]